MTFNLGDRVQRDEKTGTIRRRYSRNQRRVGDILLGPYPELYSVEWDDGSFGKAYLPHGLRILTKG
jgi:hypothetical protein